MIWNLFGKFPQFEFVKLNEMKLASDLQNTVEEIKAYQDKLNRFYNANSRFPPDWYVNVIENQVIEQESSEHPQYCWTLKLMSLGRSNLKKFRLYMEQGRTKEYLNAKLRPSYPSTRSWSGSRKLRRRPIPARMRWQRSLQHLQWSAPRYSPNRKAGGCWTMILRARQIPVKTYASRHYFSFFRDNYLLLQVMMRSERIPVTRRSLDRRVSRPRGRHSYVADQHHHQNMNIQMMNGC